VEENKRGRGWGIRLGLSAQVHLSSHSFPLRPSSEVKGQAAAFLL